jgi:hypothetical protein
LHAGKLCDRCTLTDKLTRLLADDTEQIHPRLAPLFEALVAMENPHSGLNWLHTPYAPKFLRGLATGEIPLTHKDFNQLQPSRAAAHLQEILMSCRLLPTVDKLVLSFDRWLARHLTSITNLEHARIIRQFATWEVAPWLRARAQRKPLTESSRQNAGAQIMRATEFIAWLHERNLTLATCTQATLDQWHATHLGHERSSAKAFLTWAMRTRRMPSLDLPRTPVRQRQPITQHQRLQLLRKLLTDDTVELLDRVTAILTLLYGQPLTKITRLSISDIVTTEEEVLVRFGEPPTPVPAIFAPLLVSWRDQRPNMRTATNPNSQWLFPGRRAGQPLHPATLGQRLAKAGIPSTRGRVAALRHLVLQAPAPVVADALGIHYTTAHRHFTDAGGTWKTYAPGDHGQ